MNVLNDRRTDAFLKIEFYFTRQGPSSRYLPTQKVWTAHARGQTLPRLTSNCDMSSTLPYTTKTTFTGIPSSSAVEEYIEKKLSFLEKLLAHYIVKGSEVLFEVEVGKTTDHHREGDVYRAEINFSAGGVHLRAVAVKDDLYAALDEAKDEMQRELRRHKDKDLALVKRGGEAFKEWRSRDASALDSL